MALTTGLNEIQSVKAKYVLHLIKEICQVGNVKHELSGFIYTISCFQNS
jgi:hypothetical protein